MIDSYGGSFITDLQPRTFWNTLGFTDAHIDTKLKFDQSVYNGLTGAAKFDYFNERRVRPQIFNADQIRTSSVGLWSKRNVYTNVNSPGDTRFPARTGVPGNYIPTNQALVQSDNTYALEGNENYVVDNIGYYRVEAETVFQNDFKKEDSRLGSVVSVVSKNYNANDFITGYGGDSAVPYIHQGNAQSISSVKIRIIDPKTNLPVVGLGENSTVFLEVVKAPPTKKKE